MSSDDGYVVIKTGNNEYGVFHYWASDDSEPNPNNAIKVYSHPVAAILSAHRIERMSQTEYGVSIEREALEDCDSFYTDSGWRIR